MVGSVSRWIAGARGGDRDAGLKLWERFGDRLATAAVRFVPAHLRRQVSGHDLANDALVVIVGGLGLNRWPGVRDRNELWGLLNRTVDLQTRNAVKKLYRRMRHEAPMPQGEVPDPSDPDGRRIEEREAFDRLMDRLAAREPILEAIARRIARGQTHADIARELGCSVRKVDRKVERIREILRAELGR